MARVLIYFLMLTLSLGLIECGERDNKKRVRKYDEPTNPYLTIYSGGYTVEVKGLRNSGDVELYVLADNGKAQWMHLKIRGRNEPEIMSRKYGTWNASDSYLKITIDGNTGPLVEEYEMTAGVFYNKDTPTRYLERTKK